MQHDEARLSTPGSPASGSPAETGLLGVSRASLGLLAEHRPELVAGIERMLVALFGADGGSAGAGVAEGEDAGDPKRAPSRLSRDERLLIAAHSAWLESNDAVLDAVLAWLRPELHPLATSSVDGPLVRSGSRRVRAMLRHADLLLLRPAAARPDDLNGLLAAGLVPAEVVELSQIVSFVSFQTRLVAGLGALTAQDGLIGGGADGGIDGPGAPSSASLESAGAREAEAPGAAPDGRYRGLLGALEFTSSTLAWHAWLRPVEPETGTPDQVAAIDASVWPRSPYFRLLAWNPAALTARTEIDQAVFLTQPGLPRGERELVATVTSRLNGCQLCASVHSRFAAKLTGRPDEVRRLLSEGVEFETDARWRAIVDAAAALQPLGSQEGIDADRLFAAGIGRGEAVDVIASAAFFSWANRLMLSLGSPSAPAREDAEALRDQGAQDERADREASSAA